MNENMEEHKEEERTENEGTDVTMSEPFEEDLQCALSDKEMVEAATRLAALLKEKEEVEKEKKEATAKFNARIGSIEAVINELSGVINNGETKAVECAWEYDWKAGKKVLIRLDTNEEVRMADITAEDRQLYIRGIETKGEEEEVEQ